VNQSSHCPDRAYVTVKEIDLRRLRETAENYYRKGEFACSESVIKTVRDEFGIALPDDVIAMASGFPVGMGRAGCTCGAVVGGVMALGMVFGRTQGGDPRVQHAMSLSRELHDDFQKKHKVLCCRVLVKGLQIGSPEHKNQCIAFVGEVAEEVGRLIARELNMALT